MRGGYPLLSPNLVKGEIKMVKNIIEQLKEVGKINIDYIEGDLEKVIEALENFGIKTEIQDLFGGRYLVNLGYKESRES